MTFYTNELFLRRDGKLVKIDKPDSANASVHRELLLLELRDDWTVGGQHVSGRGASRHGLRGLPRRGTTLRPALRARSTRKSLAGMSPTLDHILVNELDNVRNRVFVLTRANGTWRREPLGGMPEFGTISASAVDADESDDYFMTVADFVTPTSLLLGTVGKGAAGEAQELPAFFDAKGLADHPARGHLEGRHEDPLLPGGPQATSRSTARTRRFSTATAASRSRCCPPTAPVSARPGSRRAASTSWPTSAAAASSAPRGTRRRSRPTGTRPTRTSSPWREDLVARKVTSPPHLGIQGGSNGGLLMGNMLTQRPDLFGADRLPGAAARHAALQPLLAGASWMGEYGNPDDPKEWAFIRDLLAVPQRRRTA